MCIVYCRFHISIRIPGEKAHRNTHSIGQTHSSTNSSNGQIENYHLIVTGNPTVVIQKKMWRKERAQRLSDKINERKRKGNDSNH